MRDVYSKKPRQFIPEFLLWILMLIWAQVDFLPSLTLSLKVHKISINKMHMNTENEFYWYLLYLGR